MGKAEQLRSIINLRTRSRPDRTVRVGNAVAELMEKRISPKYNRFGMVAELWGRLLPAELREHCKITDISSGRLKVLVDSPPYMYELRLCSQQLLEELQRQCPQAKIKRIEFGVVG